MSEETQIVSRDPQPVLLTPTVPSSNDKPRLSAQAMARRRTETFDAAAEIHGATTENPLPASVGLLDTVEKKCSQEVLIKVMSTSKKFKNNVFSVIFKITLNNQRQINSEVLQFITVKE